MKADEGFSAPSNTPHPTSLALGHLLPHGAKVGRRILVHRHAALSALGVFCPALKLLASLVAGGDPEEWPDGYQSSRFIVATPG